VEVYRFGQCLGKRFSPILTFFSLVSSCAFRDAPHRAVLVLGSQTMLTGVFKVSRLGAFLNLYPCISLVVVCCFRQCLGWRLLHIYIFFVSRVFARLEIRQTRDSVSASQTTLTRLFEDARFGPVLNLHTCISLVEVYRFGQCLSWRFSPI